MKELTSSVMSRLEHSQSVSDELTRTLFSPDCFDKAMKIPFGMIISYLRTYDERRPHVNTSGIHGMLIKKLRTTAFIIDLNKIVGC